MTLLIAPAPPAAGAEWASRNTAASLFAALFQALAHCPPEQRPAILEPLESRLNSAYGDLSGKLDLLLDSGISPRDRTQGLWLLYLSFVAYPLGDVQIWIGPDLFSEDTQDHLRLLWPASRTDPAAVLCKDLEILARTVNSSAKVDLCQPGPGQLVAVLQEAA